MTTTTQSQAIHSTETIGTLGATLAAGAFYNPGAAAALNNIPNPGTTVSYDLVDIFINFGSAITTGTGATSVGVAMIESPDGGTTWPTPGTTAAQPMSFDGIATTPTAVAVTVLEIKNVPIGPYDTIPLFQNNLGVAWPVGTVITAVRKTIQNW